MINELVARRATSTWPPTAAGAVDAVLAGERQALARAITCARGGRAARGRAAELTDAAAGRRVPVLGITGTGGSGKSSLTDELVRRFRLDQEDKLRIAVIAVDPTRRRGGGALLGDRIRMNAIDGDQRVLPLAGHPRRRQRAARARLPDVIAACKAAGFDLVIVETPGHRPGRRRRSCRSSTCRST